VWLAGVLAVLVACGDPARTLTIVEHSAELVAYRAEGASRWRVITPRGNRYFISDVADRYTLVVVCKRKYWAQYVRVFHMGALDPAELESSCHDARRRVHTPVAFAEPAEHVKVADDEAWIHDDAPSVAVPAGRHDWIVSNDDKVKIVRDIPTTTDRVRVDLQNARLFAELEVDAETAFARSVVFRSASGTFFTQSSPFYTFHPTIPRELRRPGDVDLVYVNWQRTGRLAEWRTAVAGPPPKVTPREPPPTPPSSRVGDEVRWERDAHVMQFEYSARKHDVMWRVYASARWLGDRHAYRLVDPTGIPGWRWRVPRALGHVTWAWSTEPRVLPLDQRLPVGATFSSVTTFYDEDRSVDARR
jgi:hypothetical protein